MERRRTSLSASLLNPSSRTFLLLMCGAPGRSGEARAAAAPPAPHATAPGPTRGRAWGAERLRRRARPRHAARDLLRGGLFRGCGDDGVELGAEVGRERHGGGGEDLGHLLLRLLGRALGAGVLPAVVVAGLAELCLPQLADVLAGVAVEEVVAVEPHLLDEVDGQRLLAHLDAGKDALDHADELVVDAHVLDAE